MKIDNTMTVLTKVTQTLTKGIPWTVKQPDALIDHINDLYRLICETLKWDALLAYDNVGYPSVTLTINIEEEFNIKQVAEGMRRKLKLPKPEKTDKIENTGIAWSYSRYDFLYDPAVECLKISHKYNYKRLDTQAVLNIVKTMIDHAMSYLEEIRASISQDPDTPVTD